MVWINLTYKIKLEVHLVRILWGITSIKIHFWVIYLFFWEYDIIHVGWGFKHSINEIVHGNDSRLHSNMFEHLLDTMLRFINLIKSNEKIIDQIPNLTSTIYSIW